MEKRLRDGVCPKCDGVEVYELTTDFFKILPRKFSGMGGFGDRPEVQNYVCGNCGYSEFYVYMEDLATYKKNWYRRQPRNAP